MEKSKFVCYCEKEFPLEWDLSKRVFEEKGIPLEIDKRDFFIFLMNAPYRKNVVANHKKIIAWFKAFKKANPKETDLFNDLFFGCGLMILNQMDFDRRLRSIGFYQENMKSHDEYPTDSVYPGRYQKDLKDDMKIIKAFDRLIDLLKSRTVKSSDVVKIIKKIVKNRDDFFNKSHVFIYNYHQDVSRRMHGQKIRSRQKTRQKYSDSNYQIAKYLIDKISTIPSIGESGRRMNPKESQKRNYKLAVKTLLKITNQFEINLPMSLQTRL